MEDVKRATSGISYSFTLQLEADRLPFEVAGWKAQGLKKEIDKIGL